MSFLVRAVVNAAAIWLATLLVPGFEVVGGGTTGGRVLVFLVVGVVFALVNGLVRPVVKVLSFPLYILTLGLFSLVVNALMIMLTGWLSEQTEYGLRVDGFWTALVAGLVVAIAAFVLGVITSSRDD